MHGCDAIRLPQSVCMHFSSHLRCWVRSVMSCLLVAVFAVTVVFCCCTQAGQRELLVHSLPGMPAGLSKASDGNYWLSMTTPLPPVVK
jgi:hypothetical protein